MTYSTNFSIEDLRFDNYGLIHLIFPSNSAKGHLYLSKKYGQIAPLVYFLGALDLKNRRQNHLGLIFLQWTKRWMILNIHAQICSGLDDAIAYVNMENPHNFCCMKISENEYTSINC